MCSSTHAPPSVLSNEAKHLETWGIAEEVTSVSTLTPPKEQQQHPVPQELSAPEAQDEPTLPQECLTYESRYQHAGDTARCARPHTPVSALRPLTLVTLPTCLHCEKVALLELASMKLKHGPAQHHLLLRDAVHFDWSTWPSDSLPTPSIVMSDVDITPHAASAH